MKSILYNTATLKISEVHDYSGKPRSFSMIPDGYSVWHVPGSLSDSVLRHHNLVVVKNGLPVSTTNIMESVSKIRTIGDSTAINLPNKQPEPGQKKILVARFKGLGDILMSWFGLEELRKKYKDYHITYLTSTDSALLFCGQQTLVDRVIYTEYEHPASGEPDLPDNFDARNYDIVINMINRVDFGDIAYKKPRADNFADLMKVSIDTNNSIRHIKVYNNELTYMKKVIKYNPSYRYVICQLSSNGRPRVWPLEHYISLSRMLHKEHIRVIFTSSDPLHRDIRTTDSIINMSCRTSIREYIALISLCDVAVCPDSSMMHIAAHLPDIKVVSMWGSTSSWAHATYYKNVHAIEAKASCCPCWDWQLDSCDNDGRDRLVCMRRITPKMVMSSVMECFSSNWIPRGSHMGVAYNV